MYRTDGHYESASLPRAGCCGGAGEAVEMVMVDDHPMVEKIEKSADHIRCDGAAALMLERATVGYARAGCPE